MPTSLSARHKRARPHECTHAQTHAQTGSGKTFTITGGAMRYADRGIIPRTLSCIFADISKRTDYQYTVHVSYLEIYNQTGFDLLDPNREIKAMEDLPQVIEYALPVSTAVPCALSVVNWCAWLV